MRRFLPPWMKRLTKAKGYNINNYPEDIEETIATAELEIADRSTIFSEHLATIPTIRLTAETEVSSPGPQTVRANVASGRVDDNNNIAASTPTTVVATPILENDFVDRMDNSLDVRAAYVSATAFHCDGTGIGVKVQSVRGKLQISVIQNGSVFSGGPLRVGDHLVSINGYGCDPIIDGGQATRILNNLKGTVAVVVSTLGDAGFIECMLVKPCVDCDTGLRLQYLEGRLQILTLEKAGLWTHSLLNEGNHILSINGLPCSQMDGQTAETLVNASESAVTVIARAQQECVVVIDENPRKSRSQPCRDLGQRNRYAYYSPCFHGIHSPAKIVLILANAFVLLLGCVAGWLAEVGMLMNMIVVGLCLLAINIPWIGWIDHHSSRWCSAGQITGTLLVLFVFVVLIPFYLGADLTTTVGRHLCVAVPMAVIVNLPMHYSDDNIEDYTVGGGVEQLNSDYPQGSTMTQEQMPPLDNEVGTNPST